MVKHSYVRASDPLDCDLLIIDEAHRAKGDSSEFSHKLRARIKHASRVLILTATPFSIEITELNRMLKLIGADDDDVCRAVVAFKKALDRLHSASMDRDAQSEAKSLADKATKAVELLRRFVIRHGVDDLKVEQKWFGKFDDWRIAVPKADAQEVELRLRLGCALRLDKRIGMNSRGKRTNDARFDVGRFQFDLETAELSKAHRNLDSTESQVINHHLAQIEKIRSDVTAAHPKMKAIDSEVMDTVLKGEKVVLFCHHHATAQELTVHLHKALPRLVAPTSPDRAVWEDAWNDIFQSQKCDHEHHREDYLKTFIQWLCADLVCAQVSDWIGVETTSLRQLVRALKRRKARHPKNRVTIADAARQLYQAMLTNKSSRGVLQWAIEEQNLQWLPGANGTSRVLGVCNSDSIVNEEEMPLFMHSRQPDLVLELFNSPFGPDVLVVTDRLSEGIDLHRYCRHLIHYELDPSPIRTVQRNGRIRRVNSWAAVTGQRIQYAYPSFGGTRDQRLVSIMKKRIDNFSLLLGGVPDFDVDEVSESDEQWRGDVLKEAKKRLKSVSKMLVAKEPRDAD